MDEIFQQLASGQLSLSSGLVWIVIAAVVAVLGGAVAGVMLAGKDLGNELAALMGGMFGPTAAVPGVVIGLLLLHLL